MNWARWKEKMKEFFLYNEEERNAQDLFIVEMLFRQALGTLPFLLISSFAVAGIFYLDGNVPQVTIIVWLTLLSLIIFYRMRLQKFFFRSLAKRGKDLQWVGTQYRRFFALALLTAILAGISVPLFIPYLHSSYYIFGLFIFIVGIAAGAIASLFPSPILATLYTFLLTLPLIVLLLEKRELGATVDAVAISLLIVMLATIAQTTRKFMQRTRAQKRMINRKEEELRALFEQTPIPVFYFDRELYVKKFNQAFKKFFGDLSDQDLTDFDVHKIRDKNIISLFKSVIKTGEEVDYDGPFHSSFQNQEFHLHAKIVPLYNDEGEIIGGIASFQDKTLEAKSIEYLEKLAAHDPLTELGNRRGLIRALHRLVSHTEKDLKYSLLFYLDLNGFKPINDTLGHNFGDRVLQEVSKLLRALTPEEGNVFRYGGDEFVILHPHCCHSKEEARRVGVSFAKEINRRLQREIFVDRYHISMHASIGIIIITEEMRDPDEIIRHADIAMYQAKTHKSEYTFYSFDMDRERKKSFFLRQSLSSPQLTKELELYYQPIYAMEGCRIVGAEALVRWKHPKLGRLMPQEFVSLAVECGEISRIGDWVRQEVCRTLQRTEAKADLLRFISVNVDAHELGDKNFTQRVRRQIEEFGVDPTRIVLEITENSLVDNFNLLQNNISELKEMGLRWAIDDFGVGYSSLSYLQRLSFSILKIDRSFIASLLNDPQTPFLVAHISQIATQLGYRIIAEGIETREQLNKLLEIYSEVMCQGFFFERPMNEEQFLELIDKEHRIAKTEKALRSDSWKMKK